MASSFEKVMQACLESKKTPAKKTVQRKATNRRVVESAKKTSPRKRFYEDEDPELVDDEVVDAEEEPVDDEVMDDVADDIMVVVDPEVDAEDVDDVAAELQDIVDNTPEGETPTTDEYVDDYTYGCPVCGSTFFSAVELADGDECPVCGETPSGGFVFAGQVAPTEDEATDDEDLPDEDLEVDVPDEDLEVDAPDEEAEEGLLGSMIGGAIGAKLGSGSNKKATKDFAKNVGRMNLGSGNESKKSRATGYQLDESTFNPFMTKFIRENYKNAHTFKMNRAFYNRSNKTLKIECTITMKTGAKKKAVLRVENFNPNAKTLLAKDASRSFKCEGRTAPFRFSVRRVGNTIKCEGLKYNYVTRAMKEGARLQVSGNLIRESKANFTRGRRK